MLARAADWRSVKTAFEAIVTAVPPRRRAVVSWTSPWRVSSRLPSGMRRAEVSGVNSVKPGRRTSTSPSRGVAFAACPGVGGGSRTAASAGQGPRKTRAAASTVAIDAQTRTGSSTGSCSPVFSVPRPSHHNSAITSAPNRAAEHRRLRPIPAEHVVDDGPEGLRRAASAANLRRSTRRSADRSVGFGECRRRHPRTQLRAFQPGRRARPPVRPARRTGRQLTRRSVQCNQRADRRPGN